VPTLRRGLQQSRTGSLEEAIIYTHLHWMATIPDSLISRKRGPEEAAEASKLAHEVLISGWPGREPGWEAMERLDRWLRAEGNARNPGTSADLVAASLFVALHEGVISLPLTAAWSMPNVPPSA
jgi:triphosphoribosyl-dephospho-CoA synthase